MQGPTYIIGTTLSKKSLGTTLSKEYQIVHHVRQIGFRQIFLRQIVPSPPKTATYWQCSHGYSKKRVRCGVTVISNEHHDFKKDLKPHNHEEDNFSRARRELFRNAKRAGCSDLFRTTRDIVEHMLDKNEVVHSPATPNPPNVAKAVNRNRATDRPVEPTELVCDVEKNAK